MRLPIFLPLAALALAAAPAAGQTGNQSDNTGPIITGSGANGGSFLGAGLRLENEMFSRAGNAVVFRNAKTGCALRNAERAYRDSVSAVPQSPSQQRVLTLMGVDPGTPPVDDVAAALAHGAAPGSPLEQAARAVANALNGLMRDRGACSDDRDAYDEAPQWQQAIHALNEYVRIAPDEAFSPPPPELLAIHDALQSVVSRTLNGR